MEHKQIWEILGKLFTDVEDCIIKYENEDNDEQDVSPKRASIFNPKFC